MANDKISYICGVVDKAISKCSEIYKEVETYLSLIEKHAIPTYDEMKDPETYLNCYNKFVNKSDDNHLLKVKLSKLSIDMTSLLYEIGKHKVSTVLGDKVKVLKFNKDKCGSYVKLLDSYQKDIDSVINYISTANYVISSPYRE